MDIKEIDTLFAEHLGKSFTHQLEGRPPKKYTLVSYKIHDEETFTKPCVFFKSSTGDELYVSIPTGIQILSL